MPTVSTISGSRLLGADWVYRPLTAMPVCQTPHANPPPPLCASRGPLPRPPPPLHCFPPYSVSPNPLRIALPAANPCTKSTKMRLPPLPPTPVRLPCLVHSLNTYPYGHSSLASLAQETCSCVRVNDLSGPFLAKGGLWPPSQILSLCVYNMPTIISRRCAQTKNTMPVC